MTIVARMIAYNVQEYGRLMIGFVGQRMFYVLTTFIVIDVLAHRKHATGCQDRIYQGRTTV